MRVQTTEHEFLFVAVPIAARHQAFWGRSRSWMPFAVGRSPSGSRLGRFVLGRQLDHSVLALDGIVDRHLNHGMGFLDAQSDGRGLLESGVRIPWSGESTCSRKGPRSGRLRCPSCSAGSGGSERLLTLISTRAIRRNSMCDKTRQEERAPRSQRCGADEATIPHPRPRSHAPGSRRPNAHCTARRRGSAAADCLASAWRESSSILPGMSSSGIGRPK